MNTLTVRLACRASVIAALIFAFAPAVVCAQVLRGTVRDSGSVQPIPGVVVIQLDSSGHSLGRGITNERGEYRMPLSAEARRVQALRIGFRPRDVAIPAAVDGTAQVDVIMRAIPTLLDLVSVTDQPGCSPRPDRHAAFALWEQAKTALLATVVAREANPARVVRLHFARRMAQSKDSVVAMSVRIDSAATTRPFAASRPAAEFVDSGFVHDEGGTRLFSAPDADVMLDDAFVRGYCFHIAGADRSRPREIGLGFAPAKQKRGRIDIEGSLWIDSVSRTLTDIEFRYVGLEARLERFRLGGRISFRSMDNGTVLIDRWFIRTVAYAPETRPGMSLQQLLNRPFEAQESGGEVAHARWPDGREWQASLGTFRGRVTGPTADPATVRLVDTDYRSTTDSSGAFEISNLLPGPYSVGLVDERLAALGVLLQTPVRFVAVRDSVFHADLAMQNAADYVATKCSGDGHAWGEAALIVRVLLPDGKPAVAAQVDVRSVSVDGNIVLVDEGESDELGLFQLCRAPKGQMLQIRATYTGLLPAAMTKEMTQSIVTGTLRFKTKRP